MIRLFKIPRTYNWAVINKFCYCEIKLKIPSLHISKMSKNEYIAIFIPLFVNLQSNSVDIKWIAFREVFQYTTAAFLIMIDWRP